MTHGLVLNLIPRSPIYPDFLTGRHIHALFLTIVSAVNLRIRRPFPYSDVVAWRRCQRLDRFDRVKLAKIVNKLDWNFYYFL